MLETTEALAGASLGEHGELLAGMAVQRALAYCQREDVPEDMEAGCGSFAPGPGGALPPERRRRPGRRECWGGRRIRRDGFPGARYGRDHQIHPARRYDHYVCYLRRGVSWEFRSFRERGLRGGLPRRGGGETVVWTNQPCARSRSAMVNAPAPPERLRARLSRKILRQLPLSLPLRDSAGGIGDWTGLT